MPQGIRASNSVHVLSAKPAAPPLQTARFMSDSLEVHCTNAVSTRGGRPFAVWWGAFCVCTRAIGPVSDRAQVRKEVAKGRKIHLQSRTGHTTQTHPKTSHPWNKRHPGPRTHFPSKTQASPARPAGLHPNGAGVLSARQQPEYTSYSEDHSLVF